VCNQRKLLQPAISEEEVAWPGLSIPVRLRNRLPGPARWRAEPARRITQRWFCSCQSQLSAGGSHDTCSQLESFRQERFSLSILRPMTNRSWESAPRIHRPTEFDKTSPHSPTQISRRSAIHLAGAKLYGSQKSVVEIQMPFRLNKPTNQWLFSSLVSQAIRELYV